MQNIAVVGLGRMGQGITTCLLNSGFPVTVYNRTVSKIPQAIAHKAVVAQSIKEAVNGADVIVSCLLNDHVVKQRTLGEHGILAHSGPESIHIGTATMLPKTGMLIAQEYEKQNKHYISATVLGRAEIAYEGKLTTYCAGKPHIIRDSEAVLRAFSSNILNLGEDPKAPLVMKIAMNYSLMTALELFSELYVFAEKSGLDLDILQQGLEQVYGHPAFQYYIDKIKRRSFSQVNFDLAGGFKDVNVFQQAFLDVGVEPELGKLLESRFLAALSSPCKDQDWSSIYEVIRHKSGLEN